METKVYNQTGKETGKVNLPDSLFNLPWNEDLVHQVVVSMESNSRANIAHTKDRSEVRGGGRKPWRQKGTGRARHGSRRSPIWVGGGVTFGPRNEENFSKKVNKKMKTKALLTTLSKKFKDGEVIFVDELKFSEPKTSKAKDALVSLSKVEGFETLANKKNNNALIAVMDKDLSITKSFSNFKNIKLGNVKNLNPVDTLKYKFVIITNPKESIDFLESKNKSKKVEKKEAPKKDVVKAPVKKTVKKVEKK